MTDSEWDAAVRKYYTVFRALLSFSLGTRAKKRKRSTCSHSRRTNRFSSPRTFSGSLGSVSEPAEHRFVLSFFRSFVDVQLHGRTISSFSSRHRSEMKTRRKAVSRSRYFFLSFRRLQRDDGSIREKRRRKKK